MRQAHEKTADCSAVSAKTDFTQSSNAKFAASTLPFFDVDFVLRCVLHNGGPLENPSANAFEFLIATYATGQRASVPARSRSVLPASKADPSVPRKLSFKERRELESLPKAIEELEARQNGLHLKMADPGYHRQSADQVKAARDELELIGQELLSTYSRWEALESRSDSEPT